MRPIFRRPLIGCAFPIRKRLLVTAIAQAMLVSAQAATITVDDAGDVSSPTHCTLRDAVSSANRDAPTGSCAAGAGTDFIAFDPSLSQQTIVLTQGQISLKDDLTIAGLGADQSTISGNNSSRIFKLSAYVQATISQLTLRSGSASSGGAIHSSGSVSIVDSVVTGNTAAGHGGAIYSYYGDINVTRSTPSENQAGSRGGAMYSYYNSISISNSTVSGNSANTGGGIANYGNLIISQSTIANNSASTGAGGIDSLGELSLSNSIVADSAGGVDCTHGGSVTLNQNNLIEDRSCATGSVNQLYGDPGLGPLLDGGSGMPSHALSAGSQVIDRGNMLQCETVDQSGLARPLDGDGDGVQNCDLGAFEFVDLVAPVVALSDAPDISIPGGTDYAFSVAVSDDVRLNAAGFDDDDILVIGPGGFNAIAAVRATTPAPNAAYVLAEYVMTPPFGAWAPADNGTYQILLNTDELHDMADPFPNAAPAGVLGSFEVAIVDIAVSGNLLDIANGDALTETADGTDFGTVIVGYSRSRLFRITNAGAGTLNLSLPVAVQGDAFSVSMQPAATALQAGESTLFEIEFIPTSDAGEQGLVTLTSDDQADGAYTYGISGLGTVIATAPVVADASVIITDAAPTNSVVTSVLSSDAEDNIPAAGAFSIVSGDPAGVFRIENDGRILVADETQLGGTYNLTVSVTDETDLTGAGAVSIQVTAGDLLFRSRLE